MTTQTKESQPSTLTLNLNGVEVPKWKIYISFFLLTFCTFLAGNADSIQAPFYPPEAEKKGLNPLEYGIVFGIYEISCVLFSPFISFFIRKTSIYTMFQLAIFSLATTCTIFGFLDELDSGTLFFFCSVILRILEAIGASSLFMINCLFALKLFPNSVNFVFGIIGTMLSVGMALGPAIGGLFFEVGDKFGYGFTLPFLILGVVLMITNFLVCCALRNIKNIVDTGTENKNPGFGFKALSKVKKIRLYVIPTFGVGLCVGFLTATLEPHLRQFSLRTSLVGLMFFIICIGDVIGSLFWGYLLDRVFTHRLKNEMLTIGSCFMIIIFSGLLGPVPFFPFPPSLGLIGASLGVIGFCEAGVITGTFNLMVKTQDSFPISHEEIVSLWTTLFKMGTFVGPILGGFLVQSSNFPTASLLVFGYFSFTVLILIYFLLHKDHYQSSNEREPTQQLLDPKYNNQTNHYKSTNGF